MITNYGCRTRRISGRIRRSFRRRTVVMWKERVSDTALTSLLTTDATTVAGADADPDVLTPASIVGYATGQEGMA